METSRSVFEYLKREKGYFREYPDYESYSRRDEKPVEKTAETKDYADELEGQEKVDFNKMFNE